MSSPSPLSNGLLTQSTIHKGVWINWSQGYVRGATLTTTTTGGAILVAFLALFIQFTGTQLWGISRFTIHQTRVSKRPRDGLYHQQQAILRNFAPADAAKVFVQAGWAWRSKTRNPAKRSVPLALVALAYTITFLLAAILSATASTSQGDEVLVSSPYCGQINFQSPNLTAVFNIINAYETKSLSDSASYARSCYASEGTGRTWQDCSTFPVPKLPTTQTNASCPLQTDICTAQSIQLDTGLMDTNIFFGINAPPKDRLAFRKVTSCAPIEMDQFSVIKQGSSQGSRFKTIDDIPELQSVELYYGKSSILGTNGSFMRDYTYNHHTFLLNFTYENEYGFPDMFNYDIFDVSFLPGLPPEFSSFVPLSQLNIDNSDVTLAFLSANSIPYSAPVDDPWYSAHSHPFPVLVNSSAIRGDSNSSATSTVYFRDRPVSVLACTEQYQLCATGSSPGCTALTGYNLLLEAIGGLGLNDAQTATVDALFATPLATIDTVINLLGPSSLLARNSKVSSVQGYLPSNQWTLEVENWNQIILADIQRSILEVATGPSNPELLPFLIPPNGSSQENLCHNQRARSAQAQNFSVLAIALILALGSLITCVNLGLHRIVSYVQLEKDLRDYRRLAWKSNGLLQVQRLAHEEAGFGTWEGCAKTVPVTARGEELALLNVHDPTHPVLLKRPVSPNQLIRLSHDTTHTSCPQKINATDPIAITPDTEPKSAVEIQEEEQPNSSSSANSTGGSNLGIVSQTQSVSRVQSQVQGIRRNSL